MAIEIFNFEQGTEEWRRVRMAIPTASAFGMILAKGQGKTRKTYMLKLLGERLTGELADNYTNAHMERGHIMEAEARNAYAIITECEPQQIGFIRNNNTGCSPDSLIDINGLIEIKTKLPHLQLSVLLDARLPPEHKPQVQGQLLVAEREWCDFVSYWPRLPLFILRVYRDDKYINMLDAEIKQFNDEINELEAQIKQKYAA